jgi:FlaA1/EpsC-like NDP-sugar epimerase
MRRWYRSGAFPVHRHSLVQLIVDGGLVALAYVLAFELRFDNGIPRRYDLLRDDTILWVVPLCIVVFMAFGLYQRLWTYVGQRDYETLLRAVVVSAVLVVGGIALVHPVEVRAHGGVQLAVGVPTGVAAMWVLLTLFLTAGVRFLTHLAFEGRARGFRSAKGARTVLIVGGGDGGRLVVRELVRNPDLGLRPVGFVDDDPRKRGMKDEHHLRVLGTTSDDDLARVLDAVEPDEVIVAIPSAPGTLRGRVVAACRPRGIPVRTLPTVFELLQDGGNGGVRVMRQLRELQVEDVLGREPVRMELDRVGAYLANQIVLVTGAGGSIGGELCRQIARVGPRRLILVDHAEDNLFEIARELEEERHVRTAVPVLADCKEEERMREVLAEHRPAIVFHAAAYKHVGMMELNPVEAVRNNALATRLVARIAGEAAVKTFVLVSTDKAVSPATVMGASKALAEWAIEAAAERHPGTRFATVRFGNVLGSSGSVVPIFRRQIAAGGPVTVTDPRMQRYFMTIPEAVQLIIRSGSLSERSGEVFVLEMGEPVAIVELAKAMIRLSGLEPDRDIAIEVVGARPGEKLHEELFNPYERPQPTPAEKILRAERPRLDPEWVERTFGEINLFVLEDDAAALAAKVGELSAVRMAADRRIADPLGSRPAPPRGEETAGPAVGVPSSDA